MNFFKKNGQGLLLCLVIAVFSFFLGKQFPLVGGAIISILTGMVVSYFIKDRSPFDAGISFASKKILQAAVVLLGFGLNLTVLFQTGKESLPIIVCTITTSLVIAYLLHRLFHIPSKITTLVGVGSSICGGSAIAATAPVIDADDDEVAQAMSVIFFFNLLAAIFFPILGQLVGFSTTSGNGFGIFAGTAVNDTSSVTATASTWDSMWNLKNATLDKAVTVKLTRTLAIIPITLFLALHRAHHEKKSGNTISFKKIFPFFILYFIGASVITTICLSLGVSVNVFLPVKELSKFLILLAMAAIGLNSDPIHLVKTGGKPLFVGAFCWFGITAVSLVLQHFMLHSF